MKIVLRYSIVFSILFGTSQIFSQWQSRLPGNVTSDSKYNLNQISRAFNDYWAAKKVESGYYYENGKKKKATGWKQFRREEWFWEQRVNPITGEFPSTNAAIEMLNAPRRLNKTSNSLSNASWANLGTNSSTGGYAGIGRINCVAFHPTDTNTYWVGSPSGGIWKTTNNGTSWTCLNNNMPVIGVSDIAIPSDYATSNTIYIVTGDRDGGSLSSLGTGMRADNNSLGVYKSTNGGSTWEVTGLTKLNTDNKIIGRLLLASNNTTLYASVYTDGIYKSTDSGTNWTRIANLPYTYVIDMEFKPGDDNTIYASTKSIYSNTETFIYRTSDAGATWSGTSSTWSSINRVFMGAVGSGRIELAVSQADTTVVYAVYSQPSKLHSILKSTDSGITFTQIWDGQVANHNLLGYDVDANDLSEGQGTYDLCIAASPADANVVFIGGVNTWMTSDGGTNWKIKTHWSSNGTTPNRYRVVHADKHALEFQSANVLFEGNDGGIYRAQLTNNDWLDIGSDYVDKTNGLVISQLYRIGVSKSDVTKVITGLQDNGTKLYNNGLWKDVHGGDGMECLIDHTNPLYMYSTYVTGQIYRNSNGYSTSAETAISANIPGGQPTGAWVTPYINDPTNSQILYVGYDQIWKTTDRGDTWASISGVLSSSDKLRSLAVAPSNTNVMYVADRTHMWRTNDAAAATPTWTSITLPITIVTLTYIAVKADDPSTVWITYGGFSAGNKVFQSTDGGNTWTNISGTLPNIPVMCIAQNIRLTGMPHLFIGTDVGVYEKVGNADWNTFSTGLPAVVVTELEFYYGATQTGDRLRAGTFGRGLWETPVENLATKYIVTSSDYNPTTGSNVTITAQLTDADNNTVANSGVTVNWSKSNANGSFSSASSVTDATGKATVTFTTHTVVGISTTVTANDGTLNGTSSAITTVAGVAAKYIVTSDNYNPAAGSAVTITAQLADAANNPVTTSGVTVNWTKSDANGSFANASSITNASGIATVTFTTHASGGTSTTITANDGSLSGTSSTITTSGFSSPIVISLTAPANLATGVSLTPQFTWSGSGIGTPVYTLTVAKDTGFTDISYGPVTVTSPYQLPDSYALSNSTVYYWKITATLPGPIVSSAKGKFTTIQGYAPSLVSPANASTIIGNIVYFVWTLPVAGLQYRVELDNDANFSSQVSGFPSGLTSLNYLMLPYDYSRLPSGIYYWRVKAYNAEGVLVSISSTGSFTISGPPTAVLYYPINLTTVYTSSPTVYWYLNNYLYNGTLYFRVRYGTSSGSYTNTSNLTSSNYLTLNNLSVGNTYYYVVDASATSDFSTSTTSNEGSFVVFYSAVSSIPIYLSYPAYSTNVYTLTPTLYWYLGLYIPGVTFDVQVDNTNSSFPSPEINAAGVPNYYYTTSALTAGVQYWWRVRISGSQTWNGYESFIVNSLASPNYSYPVAAIPQIDSRAGNTVAESTNHEVSWSNNAANHLEYQIIYSSDPTMNSGVLTNTIAPKGGNSEWLDSNKYSLTGLSNGVTYYWQVRSRLQLSPNTVSNYSNVGQLTVAPGNSPVVVLPLNPLVGATINSNTANLSWAVPVQSLSALVYDLEISKSKDMTMAMLINNLEQPTYEIKNLASNQKYYWRVRSKTNSGLTSEYSYLGVFNTGSATTGGEVSAVPTRFELAQNYPNPFNPTTQISFDIPKHTYVELKVYDVLGEEVSVLTSAQHSPGRYTYVFDASNLPSGIYFYHINAGEFQQTKKMLLIK